MTVNQRQPLARGYKIAVTNTPAKLSTLLAAQYAGAVIPEGTRVVDVWNIHGTNDAYWGWNDPATPAITDLAPIPAKLNVRRNWTEIGAKDIWLGGTGAQSVYVVFEK